MLSSVSTDSVELAEFTEAVKGGLKTGDGYIKERQMTFLSLITKDISHVTPQLLKDLNSETNCQYYN